MTTKNLRDYPYGLLDLIFPKGEIFFSEEVIRNLEKAVDNLSETDRRMILLRYKDKKRIQDIGEIVGFTQGTVSARIQAAVSSLRHPVMKKQIAGGNLITYKYSLENYQLSVRTYNTLRRNGIWSLDQIQSVKHLQQMRNIGKGAIREVLEIVKENGLYLQKE